ncbi:homoserine kinase [Desulfocurvus vexinensis]|uniref:homoserine kinase n=1 Tax=Desulfocurvus vexinensis TaxID=399548 RepID=UPI0004B05E66|nr:homoserine kinase [Desulfocurvus vexinensis]
MADLTTQSTDLPCVTLIGMAGAGKSTVGRALALRLGWAHLDTDHVIEADLGRPLQDVFDGLGREAFIRTEERIVSGLRLKRCVISTGGSVVYGPAAVARLRALGPVVHLHAALDVVARRVGAGQGRGLAIAPGQTIADLYNERRALYEAAADLTVDSGALAPDDCAGAIADWLARREP